MVAISGLEVGDFGGFFGGNHRFGNLWRLQRGFGANPIG